jgi:hypothetical protein
MTTLDENKKAAEQKIKEKQAAKKEKAKEAEAKQEPMKTPSNLGSPAEVYKGTVVQLLPKEKTGMSLVQDALLYCEPCNMAGVHPAQVDFVYDSGTVNGVMGERECLNGNHSKSIQINSVPFRSQIIYMSF